MNTKKLSVCMVTKNDESYIKSCLHELEGFADEIIIADIASTDGTAEAAKDAGAFVYHIKWHDSFAEAKNFCMDHANGRWILFLQPNETISAEQQNELIGLLDNPNAEGYLLNVDYKLAGRSISSPTQFLRLIRNRKEYRFKYRGFEAIPDEFIGGIQNTCIKITHHYNPKYSWELPMRTSLLYKDINEHPDSCYLQYLYGIQLLNEEKYEDSIPYLQKACSEINDEYLFAPHLYKMLGWVLLRLKRYDKALEVLDEGITAFPYYTDFLVLRGELYKQQRRYQNTVQDLSDCLNIISQSVMMVPGPEIAVSDILEILAESQEKLFNYRQALSCYQQAYTLNNTDYSLLYKIAELTPKENLNTAMDHLLKTSVTQKNSEQLAVLLDILYKHRAYEKVLDYVGLLCLFPEKKEQADILKFSCQIMLGDADGISKISKTSPVYRQILLRQIESHWVNGQLEQAERFLREMDGIESIEKSVKALYHLIHKLLNGKKYEHNSFTKSEYEIVNRLYDLFIWKGQEEKAETLLPLLLDGRQDENLISLAKPWVKQNNEQIVEMIYQHVSSGDRIEFKQNIVEQFLLNGYTESARKFAVFGDSQSLGAIDCVLRAEDFIEKTAELNHRQGNSSQAATNMEYKLEKPSDSLVDFYRCLSAKKSGNDKDTSKNRDAELSCTHIYEAIGDIYKTAKKKDDALLSYLHSLLCDPLNKCAREKTAEFFYEDPERFDELLDGMTWNSNTGSFDKKQTFRNMVYGLIHFQKNDFLKALPFFSGITEDETAYSAAVAYKIACIWISNFGADAGRFESRIIPKETLRYFFMLCREFILNRLSEDLMQYPQSEIIRWEKERISVSGLTI